MLSSLALFPLLASLLVHWVPSSASGIDTLQTTGFTGGIDSDYSQLTDNLQASSFVGALYNRSNVTSDPLDPRATPDSSPFQVTSDSIGPLVMGYYPDWAGSDFPPTKINYILFDWIDFAFVVPNDDCTLAWDSQDSPALLDELVRLAHAIGTKIKLSIGGWAGSRSFSRAVATNESIALLVSNICNLYTTHNLDGIDIDWEYPGKQGASGNEVDASDSQNFLSFLRFLRATLPPTAVITAAAPTEPWTDSAGRVMSEMAGVLDWALMMNYDTWDSSSNPGPNAPMHDACKTSTQPQGNMVAAYNAFTGAGFLPSQLVIGVPSYGYMSLSNATSLRTRSSDSPVIVHADGDGQVQFRNMVSQGALVCTTLANPDGPRSFDAGGGFQRLWDNCSSTPYLHSPSAGQVISYDDTESLKMKAVLAKDLGLRGVNIFDISGDLDDSDLAKAVKEGLCGS